MMPRTVHPSPIGTCGLNMQIKNLSFGGHSALEEEHQMHVPEINIPPIIQIYI